MGRRFGPDTFWYESRLETHPVPGRGLGLFPKESPFHMFYDGEYVCEYEGESIIMQEGKERHARLKAAGNSKCYIFEEEHRNKKICIDATVDDGRMDRLINHSRHWPNLYVKHEKIHGLVCVLFFALKDIRPGEEFTYDYGDRSLQSLERNCNRVMMMFPFLK